MSAGTYADTDRRAREAGLITMGALHPARADAKSLDGGTLILLGCGPDFWPLFQDAPEARDRAPDPIDRWSARIIRGMAGDLGAQALFPFGGPPHAPFIDWALKSGRAWQSPVGMLVHDKVGLMISYRGALHFPTEFPIPETGRNRPCDACTGRPCVTACPVGALSDGKPYDVARCHTWLDTQAGLACMMQGCAARRACPISRGAGRQPEQSALHMRSFHPR